MTSRSFIPVASPSLTGNEKKYVMDCLDTTWISSTGKYVRGFEDAFATLCGVKYAASCTNGTVALHLALLAIGIEAGDEVLVPTLTFVATANAVRYCGATPIFIDSEPHTWNMNPDLLEASITPKTKAIIAVHLYGHPADLDAIRQVADRHKLFVIEDAAEAHGASYKGQKIGSIGDIATFSFYGNKIITAGEGGMVTTNDTTLDARMRLLKGQGMDPQKRYWFPIIGYNYRMTNVACAIGLAQLEQIDDYLLARQQILGWYHQYLDDVPGIIWQAEEDGVNSVGWMATIVLGDDISIDRDDLMQYLADGNIETRPIFHPLHTLPPYINAASDQDFPVAERLGSRGISLPTWVGLRQEDIQYICEHILEKING